MNTKIYEDIYKCIIEENTDDAFRITELLGDGRVFNEISDEKKNIISWIPIKSFAGKKVLEVNAGCGIISRYLSEPCDILDALVMAEEQARVHNLVCKGLSNINMHLVETSSIPLIDALLNHQIWSDDNTFDIVVVNAFSPDVFNDSNCEACAFYEKLIKNICSVLSGDGKIFIAYENQYSFDNWNGRCDVNGFFSNISGDNYSNISKRKMDDILNGFKDFKTKYYYPYPNTNFVRNIYSDLRLPKKNELVRYYWDNYEYDNLSLMNEVGAWNNIVDEEMFPFFAPSYLVEVAKADAIFEKLIYSKYSSDRNREYAIRTDIVLEDGKESVAKQALYNEANGHLRNMSKAEELLKARYSDDMLHISASYYDSERQTFEYVTGASLMSEMASAAADNDMEKIDDLIYKYLKIVFYGTTRKRFVPSEKFIEVFGYVEFSKEQEVADVTDIDLNFDNIIINDCWNLIDYEWTFDFEMPQKYVAYRAAKYWSQSSGDIKCIPMERWMLLLDIDDSERELFELMELSFQKYVSKTEGSLLRFSEKYHKPIKTLYELLICNEKNDMLLEQNSRLIDNIKKMKNICSRPNDSSSKPANSLFADVDIAEIVDDRMHVAGWALLDEKNENRNVYLCILNTVTNVVVEKEISELDMIVREDVYNSFNQIPWTCDCGFDVWINDCISGDDNIGDYCIIVRVVTAAGESFERRFDIR